MNALEEAIRAKAEGDKERYYELTDAVVPWLIPHMPKQAYEEVKKIIERVNSKVKEISEAKGKSPEEKRAEILKVKFQAAEELYPIVVLTFWNSSYVVQEIEGEILEGIEDMEQLKKLRSEIIRSKPKTLILEGEEGDTPNVGED